jgi:hypothetical protein
MAKAKSRLRSKAKPQAKRGSQTGSEQHFLLMAVNDAHEKVTLTAFGRASGQANADEAPR